ncbi:MAG: tetratricopeptide repeat protein [Anaerolineae bacterium]|nr:tetratricopeptide repeat protein [Anaerolineae bacterium]
MKSSALEQLEQAIAALQAQRDALGEAVVEAALGPMREKLAELRAQAAPPEQKRKQVTVLFADVSGFTAMSETLDVEEVTELMNALWAWLDGAIAAHGGRIDKHLGDGVMALWGVEAAREDDPEQAIRAALAMQAELAAFASPTRLQMRIGINTGPVLLGEVGTMGEFTAMGDTVNVASRLEQAAPVGGVLVSHATYRHVRGLFDVLPQSPLAVKGKAEPAQSYVVLRAKPRAFRMGTRGVEGVETRMVGRDAELLALQSAFADAVEGGETRLVTVVGEAGVGKSRLLYEFENWLELHAEPATYFKGRAIPAWQYIPYSIFRDLFAYRFDIMESDSAAAALAKFRAGMAGILPAERADLVGHWVGFDFSASAAVQNLRGSPDFGRVAQAYLVHYLRAVAERQATVVLLEDLHWADDSSLRLVEHLVAAVPQARLLFVGLARPALFERQPQWGSEQVACVRIELKLLSRRASRDLVGEILQKVETVPAALRDLIVDGAGGNPFYVEEMVKMLLDEEVIERRAEAWRVNLERLEAARVPATLTGILQARLDSLPGAERELLQRAAVVGRRFWDAAVAELAGMEREEVKAALDAACGRELIFRRERSAFAGTEEYLFKHALLRDVAYETVLLKARRRYHGQVAHWLEAHAGERVDEYAGLIAEHLEQAGQAGQAAGYLCRVGERALATGALREALGFSDRALALLPDDSPARVELLIQAGDALMWLSDYGEARRRLEAGLELAQQLGNEKSCTAALCSLGNTIARQGDWSLARAHLEESLALARRIDDRQRTASALWNLGWVGIKQGAYAEAGVHLSEGRALFQALGDRLGLARALNGLGSVAHALGDYERAGALRLECLVLFRETGNRLGEGAALNNLGETVRLQGDYAAAQQYYREALDIFREIDYKSGVAGTTSNLGHTVFAIGDDAAALSWYRESLRIAMDVGAIPTALESLAGMAGVTARQGQPQRALALLGVVLEHPALAHETVLIVEQALAELGAQLAPEEVAAGLARGRALQLEAVALEVLEREARR